MQRQVADSEYEITYQDRPLVPGLAPSWHAPNRAHGFRAYFTAEGLRVIPRTEDAPAWQWMLGLSAIGRGEAALPAEPARLTPKANRITYDRGAVQEWYVNSSRGLEQGFVLSTPPEGDDDLVLVLAMDGDLSASVSADGLAIDFLTPTGARALRYSELSVTDATGRSLPARMEAWCEAAARGIRIVVEDRDAVWPVTVDPLLTSPAWIVESDQESAFLGFSVGTAGDVNGDGYSDVIVGAHGFDNGEIDEGRAFLYHGSASGLSTTPSWTGEGNQESALFGFAVATAGDVNGDGYSDVVVGARDFSNGETLEGRAFVYLGSASGLSPTASWMAEGDQAVARFGIAVGTAGDVNGDGYSDVLVAAHSFDNGESDEGRVFLYVGSASGLSPAASWTAESNQTDAHLGISVGTAGDVNGDGYGDVIVGAYAFGNGETDEGRAFVYLGSASGLSPTASWTAESNQADAWFGFSVGTAGDVNGDGYSDVIVGARQADNGETDEGRAFVYLGSASGLSPTASWTAESNQASTLFGNSVGTAGDVNGDGYSDVIVGAYAFDNGETDEGRAFVYLGSASGLSPIASWTAEGNQASAYFGFSVGTAGDVNGDGYSDVIVGAHGIDNPLLDEGRALVYLGSASGLATNAGWTAESDLASAHFGLSVGTAGDVNGDGYSDVIVGAPNFNNEGRAFVYLGSASGLSLTASWTAGSSQGSEFFGNSVGTAGDVNGDGYSDVIVGAPSSFGNGRALVYYGSPSGLSSNASWTAEGNQGAAQFGFSVGTAGDIDGDGYADVIVGAMQFDNGQSDEGRAFVYHGSPSGLSPTASWTAEGDQAMAHFGWSVGTAGDINGDGYSDVIVGALDFDNDQTGEGRAFVYHGSVSGLSPTANWTAEGDQATAFFGYSAGTAGDVNGDGYADVIVGAYNFSNDQNSEGRAFVYHGSASGLSPTASWTAEGDQPVAQFGYSVGCAGDVNGDGYADVIVGANKINNGQTAEGRAFVYHGSASGLSPTAGWAAEGDQALASLGYSVGTAGDVNGDGFADVIVGASNFDNGQTDEGRAFFYYGNGGRGLSLNPQQRKSAGSALIARLGASSSADSFRLSTLGRTPFGRGRLRLEWEVKPLGTLFDGTATQMSAGWADSGIAGASFTESVVGLVSPAVHHWRVRLRYHPGTSPFLGYSRWFTVPWNGWQEADLRTFPAADLTVTQTGDADPILFGPDLTWAVTVSNGGPHDTPITTLRNMLPSGATFVSASPSQGNCSAPSFGVVTCQLGLLAAGADASVAVTVTPPSPASYTNSAEATLRVVDPFTSDNVASTTTNVVPVSPGDRVWRDTDEDGIQDPGEPGAVNVFVELYDDAGHSVALDLTNAAGTYTFPSRTLGEMYRVKFIPPVGYRLTLKDHDGDDTLDSDADPTTEFTSLFVFAGVQDALRWDAGLIACVAPGQPIFIYGAAKSTDGNRYPILGFQDSNQPSHVTGYNVRRSSDPSQPPSSWPLVASDVSDMDAATPNNQWVDATGDVAPGGIWYYEITAIDSICELEGTF